MENAARTAEHFARIAERRAALRDTCTTIFASKTEFVWEIGCGHGHFLTAYAAVHPDRLCVGVDIELERIERAVRKRDRAGLPNLHFVRADVHDFLASLPDSARFTTIYVLFPDPWPKKRHHKNRLIQPGFIATIAARANQGCRLYFRTDHREYFCEAQAAFESSPDWRISGEPWPFELPTVFQQRADVFYSLVAVRGGQEVRVRDCE